MINRRKSLAILAATAVFALPSSIPSSTSYASSEKPLAVRWAQNRLSIEANSVPLASVLREVAKQTGVEVKGADSLQRSAHLEFSDLPLHQALERILANVNYALLAGPTGPHGEEHLTVMVLGESTAKTAQAVASDPKKAAAKATQPKGPVSDADAIKEADNLNHAAASGDLDSLRTAAATGDPTAQAVALRLLSASDPDHARGLAIAAAKSADLDRRLSGLQTLGDLDGPDATATLGAALKDPSLIVRQAALTSLVGQTEPETVNLLVEATRDRDPSIRIQALEFLSQKGAEGEAGLTLALGSPDTEVRSRARELLDQMNPAP